MTAPGSGVLAGLFTHVVFKILTPVETDARRSNQHEFNASVGLRDAFGLAQPQQLTTDFLWMPDDAVWQRERGVLTWYDARANHPTRSEYRLYYRDNNITRRAGPGDLLLIARRPDRTVMLLLAPGTGLAAARIAWLFGIEAMPGSGFSALSIDPEARRRLARAFGVMSPGAEDWESEQIHMAGTSRPDVIQSARAAQDSLGKAIDCSDDWSDLAISLPETAPSPVAGPGLDETIRGLLSHGARL